MPVINPINHPLLILVFSFAALTFSNTFEKERPLLLVMPLILSFFLISDIGSPRWGLIHVRPANLDAVAASLHRQP